jgi:hypothetical protein
LRLLDQERRSQFPKAVTQSFINGGKQFWPPFGHVGDLVKPGAPVPGHDHISDHARKDCNAPHGVS